VDRKVIITAKNASPGKNLGEAFYLGLKILWFVLG
jgi:hypothetical protein